MAEPYWIRYIKKRVHKDNKNFLAITSGPTGSGKSWAMLAVAEQLDPEFAIDRIVFRGDELMALINSGKLKRGSVILFDEAQVDLNARNWQNLINKMLNYLISTFRHRNFVLLFTSPYADFIDSGTMKLFHANFETVSINKAKETVTIKPKLLQYNQNMKKWYRKYLQFQTQDGNLKVKRWKIAKPSDKLIEDYEIAKGKFTNSLNKEIEQKMKDKKDKENGFKEITTEPNIKCIRCAYEWHTTTKNSHVLCPRCHKTTPAGSFKR